MGTLTRASDLHSAMMVQITQGIIILTTRTRIYPEGEAEVEGGGKGTGV